MGRSKEQDRVARRLYHLAHCIMRMKHRYGLSMDGADYDDFCRAFSAGKVESPRTDDKGWIEGWLEFKDTWVCMSFNPKSGFIGTIMPAPPPRVSKELAAHAARSAAKPKEAPEWLRDEAEVNKRIAESAKKMAYSLFEQAMNHGKVPRWLQNKMLDGDTQAVPPKVQQKAEDYADQVRATMIGMDPAVKRADLSWYKSKMNDVRAVIKQGRFMYAACMLDAITSLPKTFRPSAELDEAEKLVAERIERERPHMEKWFAEKGLAQSIAPTEVS